MLRSCTVMHPCQVYMCLPTNGRGPTRTVTVQCCETHILRSGVLGIRRHACSPKVTLYRYQHPTLSGNPTWQDISRLISRTKIQWPRAHLIEQSRSFMFTRWAGQLVCTHFHISLELNCGPTASALLAAPYLSAFTGCSTSPPPRQPRASYTVWTIGELFCSSPCGA